MYPAVKPLVDRTKLALKAVEANLDNPETCGGLWGILVAPRLRDLQEILRLAPPPHANPLTGDHVRKLRDRIQADLARVPVNSTYYHDIKDDVDKLVPVLESVAEELDLGNPIGMWKDFVAPTFQDLTSLLTKALNLDPDTNTGACYYEVNNLVDCIFCTDTQCMDLDGTFDPGNPCST
jgi:hypothetical protein